jgi:Zn-dependent protease
MSETAQIRVLVCVAWFLSVYAHEVGHSTVAFWGGDEEVLKRGGFSPVRIWFTNPILSLVVPMLSLFLFGLPLPGAAVQIRADKLRSRGWLAGTFLGGPVCTVLVSLALVCLYLLIPWTPLRLALAFVVWANALAFLINITPIPPLDGFGVLTAWMPRAWIRSLPRLVPYVMISGVMFLLRYPLISETLRNAGASVAVGLGIDPYVLQDAYGLFVVGRK